MVQQVWEAVKDFVLGFYQGLLGSTLQLLSPQQDWIEFFGDGQITPLSGSDDKVFTKVKYLGRVTGAAAIIYLPFWLVVTLLSVLL